MLTFKSQAGDVRTEQHKERIFHGAAVAKQLGRAGFVSGNTVQSRFCVYFLEQPELTAEEAQKAPSLRTRSAALRPYPLGRRFRACEPQHSSRAGRAQGTQGSPLP